MKPINPCPGVCIEEVPIQRKSIAGASKCSADDLIALRGIAARADKRPSHDPVLFTGPARTAKLLTARVLAGQLRLPLYRINLSAVVSKYIGETEKNLARIFESAEHGAAILFFDEADALFGKRSEVKDAHDRYLDLEARYLLHQIESYCGLSILAMNLEKENLRPAFLRRMQFIVSFPPKNTAKTAKPTRRRTKRC